MAKCLHKHLILTTKNRLNVPKGWEWYQEQDKIDLADYIEEYDYEPEQIFCEDCGEYLTN